MAGRESNPGPSRKAPKPSPTIEEVVEILVKIIKIIKDIVHQVGPSEKPQPTNQPSTVKVQKTAIPYCLECEKEHTGECEVRCSYCHRPGHSSDQCPRSSKAMSKQAREESPIASQTSRTGEPDKKGKQKMMIPKATKCAECLEYHHGKCHNRCHYCLKYGYPSNSQRRAVKGKALTIKEPRHPDLEFSDKCYYCGQTGHYMDYCPTKKK